MNALRQREQQVLAEGREWTRQRLEEQLQLDSISMEMICPESGEELEDARWRDLQLETVAGTVRLKVRHGYSAVLACWICPARLAWGLAPYARMSPELEARVLYTATEVGSYGWSGLALGFGGRSLPRGDQNIGFSSRTRTFAGYCRSLVWRWNR